MSFRASVSELANRAESCVRAAQMVCVADRRWRCEETRIQNVATEAMYARVAAVILRYFRPWLAASTPTRASLTRTLLWSLEHALQLVSRESQASGLNWLSPDLHRCVPGSNHIIIDDRRSLQ